jgi:pimeloyl-ACP methyl ester carboxylesterase
MQENQENIKILAREHGPSIAYAQTPSATGATGAKPTQETPGLVFLGGYMSDMTGTKAIWLENFAKAKGFAFLRFDYSGHGKSEGNFEDGTIGSWLEDVLVVLDHLTSGPQLLIGSSMGGWLALLATLQRPKHICGLVGLAAAPDFTEDLVHNELTPKQRETMMRDGVVYQPSDYGDQPYAFTRDLLEDGRRHLLLTAPIKLECPVRLLHGYNDTDVPWQRSLTLLAQLQAGRKEAADIKATLIPDADHRLARDVDLDLIGETVMDVLNAVKPD